MTLMFDSPSTMTAEPVLIHRRFKTETHNPWQNLDWTRSDSDLAVELGLNKAKVNAIRAEMGVPCATHAKIQARLEFGRFLRSNEEQARILAIPNLVSKFSQEHGISINHSAAYRVAMRLGYRGLRQNKTRYANFWKTINWMLPDSDLSRIWGVERGNIQSKRKVLSDLRIVGVFDRPLWRHAEWKTSKEYRTNYRREKRMERVFVDPRAS